MRFKKGTALMALGLLLLLAAMSLAAFNVWDMNRAAESAQQIAGQLSATVTRKSGPETEFPEQVPDYILAPDMAMPVQSLDGVPYIGILEIPELNLTLPVASEWSETLLKDSPCRYAGSAYQNNLVIAAHNYARHFGGLKDLHLDSEIRFTDIQGNVFLYRVSEFETLPPTGIQAMTSDDRGITLFTCTLDGQNRITVRADRTES